MDEILHRQIPSLEKHICNFHPVKFSCEIKKNAVHAGEARTLVQELLVKLFWVENIIQPFYVGNGLNRN